MDIENRIDLIKKAPIEEVITEEDLRKLLESKQKPVAYDGFEPSGLLHLGSGVMRSIKTNDFLEANVDFVVLLADWFGYINNKMGGDLELIKSVGQYFIEGWKACGMNTDKIQVKWTSDMVTDPDYWKGVIDIAKHSTIKRTLRAGTIMGREEGEMQYTAQLLYPMMQAWDPLYMNVDIMQLGMDQRNVTVLTRELAPKLGFDAPVAAHHHLLGGLQGPGKGRMGQETATLQIESKMSKSKPNSAIFIHDSEKEVQDKLKGAYCPVKVVEGNPIIELWKHIIFRKFDNRTIERPSKFGGNLELTNYQELVDLYKKGDLHPLDLKNETANAINEILNPVRKHFESGKARELYEIVKEAKKTR